VNIELNQHRADIAARDLDQPSRAEPVLRRIGASFDVGFTTRD